jgi:hypothetical protein
MTNPPGADDTLLAGMRRSLAPGFLLIGMTGRVTIELCQKPRRLAHWDRPHLHWPFSATTYQDPLSAWR